MNQKRQALYNIDPQTLDQEIQDQQRTPDIGNIDNLPPSNKRQILKIKRPNYIDKSSTTQTKISQQNDQIIQGNAILASNIIKQIMKSSSAQQIGQDFNINNKIDNKFTQYPQLPLRERILKTIQNSQVPSSSKYQLSKLFKQGVVINRKIWNQRRITVGCVKTINSQNNEGVNLCSFCPNNLVTRPLFKKIMEIMTNNSKTWEQICQHLFISGYYGISKTFSFLLYSLLSDYIIKYIIINNNNKKQIPYKITKIPKLIYLSIINQQNYLSTMKQNILNQCSQIINTFDSCQKKNNFEISQIKNHYLKLKIPVILVVDQINIMASVFRRYKTLKTKIESLPENKLNQKNNLINQQLVLQNQYISAFKIKQYIKDIRRGFSLFMYLSSLHFNDDEICQMDLIPQSNHQRSIPKFIINYPQNYFMINSKDMADYFMFQFSQRHLKSTSYKQILYSNNKNFICIKQQIRQEIWKNQMKDDKYYFVTPLLIRQSLNKIQEKIRISLINVLLNNENTECKRENQQNSQMKRLKNIFIQSFRNTCLQSQNLLKDKLVRFVRSKNNSIMNKLIIKIYFQAKKIQQIKISDYKHPFTPIKLELSANLQKHIQQNIDYHIFKYHQREKFIQILLPNKFVMETLQDMYKQIMQKDQLFLSQIQCYQQSDNISLKGSLFQYHYVKVLSSPGAIIKFPTCGQIQTYQINNKILAIQQITSSNLKQKNNSYSLIEQLKPYFIRIVLDKQNKNKDSDRNTYLVLPCRKLLPNAHNFIWNKNYDLKISTNNLSFDFILMKFNYYHKSIKLKIIDLTLVNDRQSLITKIRKFLTTICSFKDSDHENSIIINKIKFTICLQYNILGPFILFPKNNQFGFTPHNLQCFKKDTNSCYSFKVDTRQESQNYLEIQSSTKSYGILQRIGIIDTSLKKVEINNYCEQANHSNQIIQRMNQHRNKNISKEKNMNILMDQFFSNENSKSSAKEI